MLNYRQWCIADPADKRPRNIHKKEIGVHDLDQLTDYYTAKKWADTYGWVIGFILTESDPFTCIDLDIKEGLDPEEVTRRQERFASIIQTFASYTEYSLSGKGFHVWVLGNIGAGRKRDGVEIYSRERFIICTGNPLEGYAVPITNGQAILDKMIIQMPVTNADFNLDEGGEELLSDQEVLDKLDAAANADKFNALWYGKWQELGYPSASEAELSLMSMFAFYSKNNEQCRRLFRFSWFGERDKHRNTDVHIDRTLRVIRKRQAEEEQREQLTTQMAQQMAARYQSEETPDLDHVPDIEIPANNCSFDLDWPPGVLGYLAQYFYQNSPRPVKEIAITSAMALISGICGKAWNVNGTGLNGYYIMIAPSGVGKEALYSSMSGLLSEMEKQNKKFVHPFVDFTEHVSAPSLLKSVFERQCCVNTFREFGKFLEELQLRNVNQNSVRIKTALTKLYSVSGHDSYLGGLGYSKAEDSVDGSYGVSYSMIGETTPGTFFNSLDGGMMEDGFLSRFILVNYDGMRVPLNNNKYQMEPWLSERLCQLATTAMDISSKRLVINIQSDYYATHILTEFDKYCDARINETKDEFKRQAWNRAHLKVMREAAKMAVCDNPVAPIICREHVEWAIKLIQYNHSLFMQKAEDGEIVSTEKGDDNNATSHFKERLARYLRGELPHYRSQEKYQFQDKGIISRTYIMNFVCQSKIYLKAGLALNMYSKTKYIDYLIGEYLKNGHFIEIPVTNQDIRQGFQGKLYKIISLP